MKKVFISFGIMMTVAFSSVATQEIDKMINDIRKPRKSLNIGVLERVKDPFVVEKVHISTPEAIIPVFKKPTPQFSLSAIVNNKAHINGDWLEEGGMVKGYKLAYVGTRGVVLTIKKDIVKLFLPERTRKSDETIKIKEGM